MYLEQYCKEASNVLAHDYENFRSKEEREKRREERREKGNIFERLAQGIKKTVSNVGKIGLLLPFVPAMKGALKAKGIETKGKSTEDIAESFYNTIVKPKGHYVSIKSGANKQHLAAELVEGVISGIISFFRGLKAKKDSGEPMADWERKAVETAEKGADYVVENVKWQAQQKTGEAIFKILPVVGIFLVLWFLSKRS